jgi:hypothetical protein
VSGVCADDLREVLLLLCWRVWWAIHAFLFHGLDSIRTNGLAEGTIVIMLRSTSNGHHQRYSVGRPVSKGHWHSVALLKETIVSMASVNKRIPRGGLSQFSSVGTTFWSLIFVHQDLVRTAVRICPHHSRKQRRGTRMVDIWKSIK